jgi:hypothetical protein
MPGEPHAPQWRLTTREMAAGPQRPGVETQAPGLPGVQPAPDSPYAPPGAQGETQGQPQGRTQGQSQGQAQPGTVVQ